MTWEIRQGDALERLREMEAESVQCCVTSPPYWGLRDYGVDGQLGLEETRAEYVASLVNVFREVSRSMVGDGTLWLNLGDSYNAYNGGAGPGSTMSRVQTEARPRLVSGFGLRDKSLKPKDLLGLPWEIAFALRADGWWLRDEIIWAKGENGQAGMPGSQRDRCTRSHEQIFMLTKSARYFYDFEAIREPATSERPSGNGYERAERLSVNGRGQPHRWENVGGMRTKRSVWNVAFQPYREAHFATFPPKLIEPCILAGSRPGDTVLDPFAGAATTGLVATRHGRDFLGIELNPEYVELGRNRIRDDAPIFNVDAEVAA